MGWEGRILEFKIIEVGQQRNWSVRQHWNCISLISQKKLDVQLQGIQLADSLQLIAPFGSASTPKWRLYLTWIAPVNDWGQWRPWGLPVIPIRSLLIISPFSSSPLSWLETSSNLDWEPLISNLISCPFFIFHRCYPPINFLYFKLPENPTNIIFEDTKELGFHLLI